MGDNVSLLDRAKADLKVCKQILAVFSGDDLMKDAAAYHLTQSIEKALKFKINARGREYPYTHLISRLADKLRDLGEPLPELLINNLDILDTYATKTRYSEDVVSTRFKIDELIPLAEKFIQDFAPTISVNPRCQLNGMGKGKPQ